MKYTNIKVVMDRVMRHPLLKDIPFETVLDYAIDFIRIVGIPPFFIDKTVDIQIENYRGELPCDFSELVLVRLITDKCSGEGKPAFRYSTDSFHYSDKKPKRTDLTYKVLGNCIFTSIENGQIEIAYRAMPIDDEGYPAIPDDSIFLRALESYIKLQWFTIQFDMGRINQNVYQNARQQYAWNVGQCQNSLRVPTVDQMEALSNMWNTLFVRATEHRHGFLHNGTKEHTKIH